jgi:hypothetical protein
MMCNYEKYAHTEVKVNSALRIIKTKDHEVIIFNTYWFIRNFNCIKLRFHIQRIVIYCGVT